MLALGRLSACREVQRSLCVKALAVLDRTPSTEDHLQRCTHVTLPSIASGQVLIGLENGRVGIQTATHSKPAACNSG